MLSRRVVGFNTSISPASLRLRVTRAFRVNAGRTRAGVHRRALGEPPWWKGATAAPDPPAPQPTKWQSQQQPARQPQQLQHQPAARQQQQQPQLQLQHLMQLLQPQQQQPPQQQPQKQLQLQQPLQLWQQHAIRALQLKRKQQQQEQRAPARKRLRARLRPPCLQNGNGGVHSLSSRQTVRAERSLSGSAPYRNSTATSRWVRKRRRYRLRLRHRDRLRQQPYRHELSTQPLSRTLVLYVILLKSLTMNAVYVELVWRALCVKNVFPKLTSTG